MGFHFHIDLETMSTAPNAAIVSIGAVFFTEKDIVDTLYTPVSLQSCLDAGLHNSATTELWWSNQSPEARAAWEVENPPSLLDALSKLNAFMCLHASKKQMYPWGNGADFDLVILKSAFDVIGCDTPWPFYNQMCFRAVKNLFKDVMAPPKIGTNHNALDDAINQTKHLQKIIQVHNLKLP
jgi:hypothetical protein